MSKATFSSTKSEIEKLFNQNMHDRNAYIAAFQASRYVRVPSWISIVLSGTVYHKGLPYGPKKKTEFPDKSSITINILLVFFEP